MDRFKIPEDLSTSDPKKLLSSIKNKSNIPASSVKDNLYEPTNLPDQTNVNNENFVAKKFKNQNITEITKSIFKK